MSISILPLATLQVDDVTAVLNELELIGDIAEPVLEVRPNYLFSNCIHLLIVCCLVRLMLPSMVFHVTSGIKYKTKQEVHLQHFALVRIVILLCIIFRNIESSR